MESSSSSHQEFPVPLPCLVIDHDGAGGEPCTTLLDISKGEYQYQTCDNIDVLRNRQRWVTPQGWVLSWNPSTFSTFLWSPQTSEKIALPSLTTRRVHKDSACCLSDKPTSNTGFTVVVADQDDTVIWYCHVGGTAAAGSGWVRHEYHLGIYRIAVLSGSMPVDRMITWMAAYQGKFYFIKSGAELGVLEFSPKPVITSLAVPSVNRPTGTTDWVASCVELDGELYLVAAFLYSITGYDTSVLGGGVYMLDFEARRWRTVRSIGDRAFVMGRKHFGGWCAATISGLTPNRVYWMGLGYNMNLLHVFDISGGTYEVHNPCKGIAGRYCNAVWMLPTDSMIGDVFFSVGRACDPSWMKYWYLRNAFTMYFYSVMFFSIRLDLFVEADSFALILFLRVHHLQSKQQTLIFFSPSSFSRSSTDCMR